MSVLWDLGGSQDMVHQWYWWYSTEDLDNLDQVYLLSSGRTNIPSLSNLKLRSLTYNNCDIFKNSQRFSWSWCRSHPTVTYAVAPPDGFTCLLCSCVCPWTAAPADVPLVFTGQRSGLVHRLVSSAVLTQTPDRGCQETSHAAVPHTLRVKGADIIPTVRRLDIKIPPCWGESREEMTAEDSWMKVYT